ncbi:nitroreductase/quinone reductase family protein [Nocardia sp. NPDC058658]|uniref:nitroreductase/quinone reductase family protein n=1 Tax=Nocardia sp. NPDC058658 TaxID=3346580 RepID=UPI003655BD63
MTEQDNTLTSNFDFQDFQQGVIAEFRANAGRVGGMFADSTLVLLTTTGARTGLRRTTPLGRVEVDGNVVVVASANGAPIHPAWFHNIRKNPMVTVELGPETFDAIAAIPGGAERDQLFEKVVAQEPGYGVYQAQTTRVIPVVILHRVNPADGVDRVRGLGDFIVESHDWLRRELRDLLDQVTRTVEDGAELGVVAAPKPDLAHQLRTHCLDFCGALKQHHRGESMGAFPMLAQRFPGLRPVLEKLGEEHKTVAALQERIELAVQEYRPGESDPRALLAELTDLAGQLESHFAFEEQSIVTALNALGPAPDHIE